MRRDKNSERSQKFISRNDLQIEANKDYVIHLLNVFGIKNYRIEPYKDYGQSLFICNAEDFYVLVLDKEYVELKLFSNNEKYKEPYRFVMKDSCYKNALKEILKNIKDEEEE